LYEVEKTKVSVSEEKVSRRQLSLGSDSVSSHRIVNIPLTVGAYFRAHVVMLYRKRYVLMQSDVQRGSWGEVRARHAWKAVPTSNDSEL